MTLSITPVSRLGLLVGQPIVVSSAFLYGPVTPFVVTCRSSQLPGMVDVAYSPVRGAAEPARSVVSAMRTVESFAHEYCKIDVIGRITLINGARWPRLERGAKAQVLLDLPPGLSFEDVYPGIRDLGNVSAGAAPYVSYVVGRIEAPVVPEVARARASAVKDQYGQLVSDVVYRIENSALFDNTVPQSKEFQLALLRWDDAEQRSGPGALDGLSRELQLAFDAARRHAETLGLRHLPWTARRTARHALKAAHLANNAASDGEREAARAKVAHLLGTLALYYLPTPSDSGKMLGAAPAQLAADREHGVAGP